MDCRGDASRSVGVKIPSTGGEANPDDRRKYAIPQEEKRPKELQKMTQVSTVNDFLGLCVYVFTFGVEIIPTKERRQNFLIVMGVYSHFKFHIFTFSVIARNRSSEAKQSMRTYSINPTIP